MNNFKKLHLGIIVVFVAIISMQSLNAATKLSGTLTSSLGAYGTTTESYPLTNANDGDLTSFFWSNATPVANDYLLFTLNTTTQIGDIKFVFANNDQPNGVVVEVSEDNSVWESVATFGNSDISASPYTYVCNAEAKVAKYVRLRFTESATGWVKVTEFQVYEYSSTPTLSLTAETEIPYYWTPQNFVVDYVVDGDVDSYFFSSRNLATGDYITLTLAQESTISDIKLTFMNGDQPNGSVIEISNDKSDWTQVASFNKSDISTTDYTYSCSLSNAVAKYVRLRFTEASDGWFKLAEFEVIPGETAPIPSRTITVTSSPAEGGTVTANNVEGGVTAEGAITLKAEPSDNYKFVRWTLEGETVSSTTTYTDREEGDKEYIAEFVALTAEEKYALLCTPEISAAGNTTYVNAATITNGVNIENSTIELGSLAVVGQQGVTSKISANVGATFDLNLTYVINWNDLSIYKYEGDSWECIYGLYDGAWTEAADAKPLDRMVEDGIAVNGTTATFPITFSQDSKVGDIVVIRALTANGATNACPTGLTEGGYVDFLFEIADGYVAPKYAVSAEASPAEGGQVTISATEVQENATVTLSATANEGYDFVNWTVNGTEVSVDANFTSVAITEETVFVANFVKQLFNVTVTAGEGGSVEPVSSPVEYGSTITLSASANEGYEFAGWISPAEETVYYIQNYVTKKYLGYNSVNLAPVDTQSSDVTVASSTLTSGAFTFHFTNATYDQQTPPQLQSYLHCGSSGRFSGNSVNTANSQQILLFKVADPTAETITATQATEIISGATYMFVGLKDGTYYALTDELYKGGTVDQRLVGAAVTITDGVITFTPGTSSALWTITDKSFVSDENPYNVTITADAEYVAKFTEKEIVKYSVSVEASPAEGGQVTISADEVEANSTVTLTATANEGYEFVNWTVAGEEVSVDANFTSEAITAETEFVANFQVKEYNVVYKVDGEEYQTVPTAFGSTITPIAEPEKEGYTFSGWSEVPETMPASDVEVTGTFTKNVYTVSVSVNNSAYGSVSPETANVEHGETITLTATANLGYQFVGWFEEGRNISNETNFSIIITSEKNYIATFEAIDKVNVTVVDENRTETKSTVYANVTVGNEKVWDVQANTISADKLSVSVDADGVASEVKIADGGQITTVLEITRTIEKGKWALMSLPFAVDLANVTVDGAAAVNNSNIKVMVYDAAYRAANSIELFTKSGWKELTGTTIAANQGFAVAINANNGDEQKVTFTATSQTYDGTDKQISLSRYASTVNEGADADWNFYGNPTLAKAQKGTGYALYVYNAEDDSYDEYASSDVATYQPYAAWFVQSADDFNAMIFSAGVAGALAEADGVFGELQFSLNGDDEARIVLVDESSEEYVRNEDALYFPAINTNLSQLYLVKGNIKMAVSEQPSLTSMAMGYKAVKSGEQTLTLTSVPENTSVVLVDNVAGTETAMTLGDTYTFQSEAGTFNNRFVIETTDLTGISQAVADGEVKVLVSGTEINVYGAEAGTEVVAYTTNGTVVASAVAEEGVTTLSTSATGVIVVKVANTAVKVIK